MHATLDGNLPAVKILLGNQKCCRLNFNFNWLQVLSLSTHPPLEVIVSNFLHLSESIYWKKRKHKILGAFISRGLSLNFKTTFLMPFLSMFFLLYFCLFLCLKNKKVTAHSSFKIQRWGWNLKVLFPENWIFTPKILCLYYNQESQEIGHTMTSRRWLSWPGMTLHGYLKCSTFLYAMTYPCLLPYEPSCPSDSWCSDRSDGVLLPADLGNYDRPTDQLSNQQSDRRVIGKLHFQKRIQCVKLLTDRYHAIPFL